MSDRYDWAAMRADIESGRVRSFADLSAKYGATEQAIRDRRKRDEKAGNPWPLPKIARAQSDNVITLSERRSRGGKVHGGSGPSSQSSNDEPVGDDETPLTIEDEGLDPLSEQQALGLMAQRAARRGLRRYMRGQITPGMNQSEADVLNSLISASARAASMNREIAGKGKGEASGAEDAVVDNALIIEQRRVEPLKIAVGEDGRLRE